MAWHSNALLCFFIFDQDHMHNRMPIISVWTGDLYNEPSSSRLYVCLNCDYFYFLSVYEGVKSFYKEEDEAVPVNVYGKSKIAAEQFISEKWSNFAFLRSSIIFGPQTISPVPKSLPIQVFRKNSFITFLYLFHYVFFFLDGYIVKWNWSWMSLYARGLKTRIRLINSYDDLFSFSIIGSDDCPLCLLSCILNQWTSFISFLLVFGFHLSTLLASSIHFSYNLSEAIYIGIFFPRVLYA